MARPLKMLQLTRETVRYAIIGTSMASAALIVPLFVDTEYTFKIGGCQSTISGKAELTHIAVYIIFVFIIPLIVISFYYSKIVKALYTRSAIAPKNQHIRERVNTPTKTALENVARSYSCVRGVFFSRQRYDSFSPFSTCKQNRTWLWAIATFPKFCGKPIYLCTSQFKLSARF